MPDPQQSKHAEFIKFSRNLSRLTGITPSQVRHSLREFEEKIANQKKLDENGPAVHQAPVQGPNPQEQKFEPRPFAAPVAGAPAQGMGNQGGNTFEAIVYANGVLATTTLTGTTPVEI